MSETGSEAELARIEAVTGVLQTLLRAMEALAFVGRYIEPASIAALIDKVEPPETALRDSLVTFRDQDWPGEYAGLRDPIETAGAALTAAFQGLNEARDHPEAILHAYRALRHAPRAAEALYPLAAHMNPISRYFLDEGAREDEALLRQLAGERAEDADPVGVMHASNAKHERGGFSVYVPESYSPERTWPVVVALHGGSGHGRAFLWTWLRGARSRGAIVLSPTARGGTWSLMQPEVDAANIAQILDHVGQHWRLDPDRILLTGMSDGGTFGYLCGLAAGAPYTHLAPISASFQPMLLDLVDRERLAAVPIYLTHGTRDWMFPIDMARTANASLTAAGAKVQFREIENLAHTYPSEENAKILDWFLA